MTYRHNSQQYMSLVSWRSYADNRSMNEHPSGETTHQAHTPSQWRQLLGPGYQVAITNDRVLAYCPYRRQR